MTNKKRHVPSDSIMDGLHRFGRELEMFSASYNRGANQITFNICECCLQKTGFKPSHQQIELSEFGACARCHAVTDVYDLDLLAFYKAFRFSNTQIAEKLPLLRKPFSHSKTVTERQILRGVSGELANVGLTSLETGVKD